MIPSPFTAELARQHRAALAARPAGHPRRARLRAAAAEVRRLLAPTPSGPAACPAC